MLAETGPFVEGRNPWLAETCCFGALVLMCLGAKQFGLRERRTRHTLNSHLAARHHQCFSSCFQKSETSLKEIQLGRAICLNSLNTFIQRERVKRSMWLPEQLRESDAPLSWPLLVL